MPFFPFVQFLNVHSLSSASLSSLPALITSSALLSALISCYSSKVNDIGHLCANKPVLILILLNNALFSELLTLQRCAHSVLSHCCVHLMLRVNSWADIQLVTFGQDPWVSHFRHCVPLSVIFSCAEAYFITNIFP